MKIDSNIYLSQPIMSQLANWSTNYGGKTTGVMSFAEVLSNVLAVASQEQDQEQVTSSQQVEGDQETPAGYSDGMTVWYYQAGGTKDPLSSGRWSTTPLPGYELATPTGNYKDAQYDPNASQIPEFVLADGTTVWGMDRGPGDGSMTMAKLYGSSKA